MLNLLSIQWYIGMISPINIDPTYERILIDLFKDCHGHNKFANRAATKDELFGQQ